MKTSKERTEGIRQAYEKKKKARKRAIITAVVTASFALVTVGNVALFAPYSSTHDITVYAGSEYYAVIEKLDTLTYTPPRYKNNYQKYIREPLSDFFGGLIGCGMAKDYAGGAMPEADFNNSKNDYVETTDNQTQGVIEGDLIKRTNDRIFYLGEGENGGYELRGYSLAGETLFCYEIQPQEGYVFYADAEMYLSQDGEQITVLTGCYTGARSVRYTELIGISIADESAVTETGRAYFSGEYNTSRYVDGVFYIVNNFFVANNPDFTDESAFLPQYGRLGSMQSVDADGIYAPEILTSARYTFVCAVAEDTLETQDSVAFLSWSDTVYASAENMYFTRSYTREASTLKTDGNYIYRTPVTQISRLSYQDGALKNEGVFEVEGTVKNQYSMDEYEGILRVATTYEHTSYQEVDNGDYISRGNWKRETNANLYCVDIASGEIRASVEKFAPDGETVESVRFDGAKAYICTAVVVTLTDPVFAFDLSDLDKITYTDTGTIDGYSSSLIQMGDGLLLGVGYDELRRLKIELYEETQEGVVIVDTHTLDAEFSEEYKSYYIDRENGYFGIGIYRWDTPVKGGSGEYRLYKIDGYGITEIKCVALWGDNAKKRALVIDGVLYAFGEDKDSFVMENL